MGDYLLSHAIVMATGGSGVWVGREETVGGGHPTIVLQGGGAPLGVGGLNRL